MLELRPTCENCNKFLPPNSMEARICSYECTFCRDCVDSVLSNVCPNCGGGFEPRPIRPSVNLTRDLPSSKVVFNPIDHKAFSKMKEKNQNVPPELR